MTVRPRTLSLLQDCLDEEFSWRLKEIADLKISVRGAEHLRQRTVIRAAIPLLYAHWEGFVKKASVSYVEFIDYQGHKYEELASCFVVLGLKKKLTEITNARQSQVSISAVDFLLNELSKNTSFKLASAINTEANLGSTVFENISTAIGIDPLPYKAKYKLIDESLLKRRNNIAHGEYLDMGPDEYRSLADEVVSLIRSFKTDIENAAITAKYKRCA